MSDSSPEADLGVICPMCGYDARDLPDPTCPQCDYAFDPQAQMVDEKALNDDPSALPVCTQCFEPVDPTEHSCPNCGAAIGQYTINLPYEGIRMRIARGRRVHIDNNSIFGRMYLVMQILLGIIFAFYIVIVVLKHFGFIAGAESSFHIGY